MMNDKDMTEGISGMGHIAKRGRKYQASYRGPDGLERTSTHPRKIDAQAWIDAAEADKLRRSWVDPRLGMVTLTSFIDQHYRPTMVGLEPTTLARDESYLRTHISPVFGDYELAAIDYSAIQAWVNELATRRAPATVVKAAQILNKILRTAVKTKHLASNPMTEVKLPTITESEDLYLTPAQVKDLADAMEAVAPCYRALVWVGCYAGPRIGEIAALRWSDLDSMRRRLSISRKVVEVTGVGLYEGKTKTKAGRRIITIPRMVIDELDQHRERFGTSTGLMFTTPNGGQLRANNFRRREWAEAVAAAKLEPRPTPHDMRHTAVSLWIAAGASDLEVSKWAGHRSVYFTKDRYAHLFPEHGDALADRLDVFIASATSTPSAPVVDLRP